MNSIVKALLEGSSGDHVFPFFWQHGEDEVTLRKMMNVIRDCGCRSVCIESRPHPDFCGEKWWTDMDIIIDEAKKLGMKLWILDDSHFPTGYANGKVKDAPLELHRQSVVSSCRRYSGKEADIVINLTKMFPPKRGGGFMANIVTNAMSKGAPVFDDDRIISVCALSDGGMLFPIPIGNTGIVRWHKPEGNYKVYVTGLTRNAGIHREYMNMMSADSCRILIDEVYEKHWEHYKDEFGDTILGFFSDEPELGNGVYRSGSNAFGNITDMPYSPELEEELKRRLGEDWAHKLLFLWDNDHPETAAGIRLEFMDAVTKLVRKDFSEQIGSWCREHGVRYIGHVIEDNNAHTKTGMSLGHYFRGLNGQDMSGIDDIGGQVYPQQEDVNRKGIISDRDGEFYHFALGNLAASAAAIEPGKHGDSMCEIFGNYGWEEGLRLEKYLAEHFMVRGINNFVPHAFTGKNFPDPDCPPHFYAQGHNPQYRHFRKLVEYMNRVCTLISGGHRESGVAVLYNAEFEWMGESMPVQKPLRQMYENQIMADVIPIDALTDTGRYGTEFGKTLKINGQEYEILVVPYTQFVTKEMKDVLDRLEIPVLFTDRLPEIIGSSEKADYPAEPLDRIANAVKDRISSSAAISPASRHVRILDYTNGNRILYLFNEAAETYRGEINIDPDRFYEYDAWNNRIYRLDSNKIELIPNKGMILVEDMPDAEFVFMKTVPTGEKISMTSFRRSVVKSIDYPKFGKEEGIVLPDDYAKKDKLFSGIIRYETEVDLPEIKKAVLEITDAYEGVEVFVNGDPIGIQIVPAFIYDLTEHLVSGKNKLIIEVATTLEREMSRDPANLMSGLIQGRRVRPADPIGITGEVNLYIQ